MSTIYAKVNRFCKQVRGLFPSALPNGMTEFNEWSQSIMDTYDLPTSDVDSVRFTLATMMMHLKATEGYKAKFWFVLCIKAAVAKQIAGAAFNEIKQAQKARIAAEATATAVAGNEAQG